MLIGPLSGRDNRNDSRAVSYTHLDVYKRQERERERERQTDRQTDTLEEDRAKTRGSRENMFYHGGSASKQ